MPNRLGKSAGPWVQQIIAYLSQKLGAISIFSYIPKAFDMRHQVAYLFICLQQ